MATNLTRKEQKVKWSALRKEAFVQNLLEAQPKDYQERNEIFQQLSICLSYPLQAISILAGSYVLFSIGQYVWLLDFNTLNGLGIFTFCIFLFLGIECLRRWLVNATGYNYYASLKIQGQQLKKGEWLRINLIVLGMISLILVSSGTLGVYQYVKNNNPEAATLDIHEVTSPLERKIKEEKGQIKHLDQKIQSLLEAKKSELADKRSYSVWNGREYLLPEVKTRHANYDQQIKQMNAQRQKHQALIAQYEQKLNHKEEKTETTNAQITNQHLIKEEIYASITAGIWLGFEVLLIFMLTYHWVYLYNSRKEKLLEQINSMPGSTGPKQMDTQTGPKPTSIQIPPKNGVNPYLHENSHPQYTPPATEPASYYAARKDQEIGFEKWYKQSVPAQKDISSTTTTSQKSQVIIKEVPVIKYVDREIVRKEVVTEGFPVICAHCGKEEVKKRPAKYCSNTCRRQAWKLKKEREASISPE